MQNLLVGSLAQHCKLLRTNGLVTLIFVSWNQIGEWLRGLESLRQAA